MKLAGFEAQGRPRWERLGATLDALEHGRFVPGAAEVAELPALYRQVCNDLALARDRALSPALVEELNELALRGHQLLYRARADEWPRVSEFLGRDFPRAVRREWRLVLLCHVLFYSLAVGIAALAWRSPNLIYSFLDDATVRNMEEMYDPEQGAGTKPRGAEDDAAMFGYYIWNNISIAFRTFASGLAFGVGAVASLVFNALYLGLIAGHLIQKGSTEPFLTYVIGHGAFELTAILLSGVAGMRLGLAIVAPGTRTRLAALRESARASLPIISGAALMLVMAAGIEAFWSPRLLPPELKYGVGAGLWGVVATWLGLAGRAVGS